MVDDQHGTSGCDDVYGDEWDRVVRLAYLLVRSSQVAEDVAQESFVILYERFAAAGTSTGHVHGALPRRVLGRLAGRARPASASGPDGPARRLRGSAAVLAVGVAAAVVAV